MTNFVKEKRPFFHCPTQVVFFDVDGTDDMEHPQYIAGIAYRDEIICGCCGGIFQIKDVWEDAIDAGVQPIFVFEDWMDISEDITGDVDITNMPVVPDMLFDQIDNYLYPNSKHLNS